MSKTEAGRAWIPAVACLVEVAACARARRVSVPAAARRRQGRTGEAGGACGQLCDFPLPSSSHPRVESAESRSLGGALESLRPTARDPSGSGSGPCRLPTKRPG